MLLKRHFIQRLAPHAQPRARIAHLGVRPRDRDFGVDGEIPEFQTAGAVDGGEDAGFRRRPFDVVDGFVAGEVEDGGEDVDAFGGADGGGGGGADAPEFDGPVEAAAEEEVGEIEGPGGAVEREGGDGGEVACVEDAGVDAGAGTGAVVAVGEVDAAGLGAGHEVGGVGGGEGGAERGEVVGGARDGGRRLLLRVEGAGGVGGGREGRRGSEFEIFLRVGQHVDRPGAEDAVGGGGDDVMCVLGADDVEGVDGMRVAGAHAGQRGALNRVRMAGARVPEEDLAAVGAAEDEVGVEGGEARGEDVGGRVEDVFGPGVHVEVPDLDETAGRVGFRGIFGVGGEDQFGELNSISVTLLSDKS